MAVGPTGWQRGINQLKETAGTEGATGSPGKKGMTTMNSK